MKTTMCISLLLTAALLGCHPDGDSNSTDQNYSGKEGAIDSTRLIMKDSQPDTSVKMTDSTMR